MTATDTAVITCTCSTCNGKQARIKGDATVDSYGKKRTRTAIHNLVQIAHGPLAQSLSTRRNGPWAV